MTIVETLKYVTVIDKDTCIIVLSGELTFKSLTEFNELLNNLTILDCRIYIFKFREVTNIDKTTQQLLMKIQSMIRNKNAAEVRFCELRTDWKAELIDCGIIRPSECFVTLRASLA